MHAPRHQHLRCLHCEGDDEGDGDSCVYEDASSYSQLSPSHVSHVMHMHSYNSGDGATIAETVITSGVVCQ